MRDDSVLVDILSLVDVHVTEEVVSTWTDVQCDLAETWAGRLHFKASDNKYVRVPRKPQFLEQYCKVYALLEPLVDEAIRLNKEKK